MDICAIPASVPLSSAGDPIAAFARCELEFLSLLESGDADFGVACGCLPDDFEATLNAAVALAVSTQHNETAQAARLLLHRVLYRLNRLKLFWLEDIEHLDNESSRFLNNLQQDLENAWYQSEMRSVGVSADDRADPAAALAYRVARDGVAEATPAYDYFRRDADAAAYARMLQIVSFDALYEGDQLARAMDGGSPHIQAVLARMLIDEYGDAKRALKQQGSFRHMLNDVNLDTRHEAYLASVPWENLANINLGFLLSERRRYFLRYIGRVLAIETASFARNTAFDAAAKRLKLHRDATTHWAAHADPDARRAEVLLHKVAKPLIARYPQVGWELVLGYDHQRQVDARAAARIASEARTAQQAAGASRNVAQLRRPLWHIATDVRSAGVAAAAARSTWPGSQSATVCAL